MGWHSVYDIMENNTTKWILVALVAILAIGLIAVLVIDDREPIGLYIGDHEVTEEGELFDNKYGNFDYDRETNTLYVMSVYLSKDVMGYRTYGGIMLGDGQQGDVDFMISYEGGRALNIVFMGDCNITGKTESVSGYAGLFYFGKNTTVYVSGPGKLIGEYPNHSLFYGKNTKLFINGLDIETSGTIDVPVAADYVSVADSYLDLRTDSGYAGVYSARGTVFKDAIIDSVGFMYGMYLGTTYIYDSHLDIDATGLGLKVYACKSYDSVIRSVSADAGLYFYDPLYFEGGYLYSDAQNYYALSSIDTTLEIRDAVMDLHTVNGNAIQAWSVLIYDSDIIASSDNGSGIYANVNGIVKQENAKVVIDNSNVEASGAIAAVWAAGDLEIVDSVLKNGCKILSAVGMRDVLCHAVCDSSETSLELIVHSAYVLPVNASKEVWITASM